MIEQCDLKRQFVRLGEYDYTTENDCIKLNGFEDCADNPVDIKVTSKSSILNYNFHNYTTATTSFRDNNSSRKKPGQ